jgi:hypothetical protein
MTGVTRRALRVYAALSELKGSGEDVLDALIPFFEPILQVMNKQVFSPALFVKGVRLLYHWRFTVDIAESFVPRLHRKGYLRTAGRTKDNKAIYIVEFSNELEESDLAPINDVLEKIVDEFEKFPMRLTNLFTYKRTRTQLKDILIRFLVSMDAYKQNSIQIEADRALTGEDPTFLSQIEEGGTPLGHDDRYVAARFVQYICEAEPDYVSHLSRLASIGLLTEVVQDFIKPLQPAAKTNLTIVVDAPLALDYLGCSGRDLQADVKCIFDALRSIGCSFVVFPTSCREMRENLESMFSRPEPLRDGFTHAAMIKGEVLEGFVRSVAHDPETKLNAVGIHLRPMTLDQVPNLHVHFTRAQYEDFYSYVDWVKDVNPREHDAACLAMVMRLRGGKHSSDLFRSGFVFVTRNGAFARKSRSYCIRNRLITEYQAGPVITHKELAVAAWLRTGLGGNDNLPKAHLLASCDIVLRVRPEVRDAVSETLGKVTPELLPQFEALLLDHRSVRSLADQTFNDETIVTAENAERLLAVMKKATIEEESKKHLEELNSLREQHAERERIAATEAARLQQQRDAARFAVERAQQRDRDLFKTAIFETNRVTRVAEWASLAVLAILVAAGAVDYFTGAMGAYKVWGGITFLAAATATYHLVMDVRQWPKIGLATALDLLAVRVFHRKLRRLGLDRMFSPEDVLISSGQIAPKPLRPPHGDT